MCLLGVGAGRSITINNVAQRTFYSYLGDRRFWTSQPMSAMPENYSPPPYRSDMRGLSTEKLNLFRARGVNQGRVYENDGRIGRVGGAVPPDG